MPQIETSNIITFESITPKVETQIDAVQKLTINYPLQAFILNQLIINTTFEMLEHKLADYDSKPSFDAYMGKISTLCTEFYNTPGLEGLRPYIIYLLGLTFETLKNNFNTMENHTGSGPIAVQKINIGDNRYERKAQIAVKERNKDNAFSTSEFPAMADPEVETEDATLTATSQRLFESTETQKPATVS